MYLVVHQENKSGRIRKNPDKLVTSGKGNWVKSAQK